MNPFQYRDGELFCEEIPVSRIARDFGTPCWIYSKAMLLHQLGQIQQAFAAVNPVICFSVKANSNLGILKVMRDAGSSFDVVSGGELYRVKKPEPIQPRLSLQVSARQMPRFNSLSKIRF